LVAVVALCVAAGALVTRLPDVSLPTPAGALTWIAAIGLGAVAWPTLRHRSMVGAVLVYGFLSFGIIAALFYKPSATDFNGPNVIIQMARQTAGYRYLTVFLAAALVIWAISLAIGVMLPRRSGRSPTSIALHLSSGILPLAALPLIAYVYGTGFHTVLHADRYLEHTGPIVAVRLGEALGPVGVLICGYFTFHRRQPTLTRVCALVVALAYEMIFLAAATRFFAFWVLLMFAGGALTGTWDAKRQRIGFIVTAVAALLALQIPLGLRGLPNHGFIPAVDYLANQPSLVFGGHDPINNFLLGAPLTLYVANHVNPLPSSDLVTSLSPIPSEFNNWSQIAPSLRLNRYTPYSALGELLNHGWGLFLVIMALFAAGFVLIERVTLSRSGIAGGVSRIVVLGAAVLFIIESTEYNLRSVSRFFYYAFAGVLVLTFTLSRPESHDQPGDLP
jgi:hypothetical protein